ncbi:hypothetical protein [Thermococcus sp.]|uniref:hypothetical protein n=1 Tax=Thermococcus sp. TaxID=35749 RepID=UPI002622CF4D|nr:hypothetical protein [Thermococcus sp.]
MRVRTSDLFALADALVVLRDPEIDLAYRMKTADKLESLYWRALKVWKEQHSS